MRKQTWFKTVGVLAFGAQLLGGAGLAHATDNACFPMPTFADGGDPPFDKVDFVSQSHWTGSSGYGWNSGSLSEQSYQAAIGTNNDFPDVAHPDITNKQLVLSFQQNVAQSKVNYFEGMRLGFTYDYNDTSPTHHGLEHVSQIILINFAASRTSWVATPAACGATATTVTTPCTNDPAKDPATWSNIKPAYAQLLQEIHYTDGTATLGPQTWPLPSGDPTAWVREHTRLWIVTDSSTGKYTWRMQMAVPIRNKNGGTNGPDPTATWTSPGVFFDDDAFSASAGTKVKPPFWLDVMATPLDTVSATNLHYPDWADDTAVGRDGNSYGVPSTTFWGTGEMGSPRDHALLTAGDIQCSGGGLLIEGNVGDNKVWHSNLWNEAFSGTNSAGLFDDGGTLHMLNAGHAAQNQLAVQIKNESANKVDPSTIQAHFLVAPYGSQAIASVWAPLSVGGNDFTCSEGPGINHGSCTPVPVGANQPIDAQPAAGSSSSVNIGDSFTLEQKGGWTPSADYICATQSNDAPNYTWYFTGNQGPGALCANAVYTPSDPTGVNQAAAGLPGHQCIQVQLSSTSAGVQFATKSAFRNMHEASASLHRESATVDTRGLKKIKGQSYHDIYLYVETKNMPYRVDNGYSPATYQSAMRAYREVNGCQGNVDTGYQCPPGFDPNVPAASESWFAKYMPTYVVHAFADTGQSYKVNGTKVPVLTRMTSFGQFVSHDSATEGPVFGWDAGLEPATGTQFQKIGVDTYRIRIPNDGAGHVITHVEPLPTKRPVCSGTVDMNIVQLLSSIAPLVQVSPECAGEINSLVDSLQIECVDLQRVLDKIVALNWGQWTSWVKFLVQQVEVASGCKCN